MSDLKPCPFCGTIEHLSVSPCGSMTDDMPGRPHRVVCNHIDHDQVQGPVAYGRFDAATAWNARPDLSARIIARADAVLAAFASGDTDCIDGFREAWREARLMATAGGSSELVALLREALVKLEDAQGTTVPGRYAENTIRRIKEQIE